MHLLGFSDKSAAILKMAAILEKIFLALYPDMFRRLKTTIEPSFMLFTKIEQWFHPSAALAVR